MSIIQGTVRPGRYEIERSLRFAAARSTYLNTTLTAAGNRKTWTWSGWVKRGSLVDGFLFSAYYNAGSGFTGCRIQGDSLEMMSWTGTTAEYDLKTNQVFRDTASHYHIVVAMDTTQSVASNRTRLYVNGVQITSLAIATYPTQNYTGGVNDAVSHTVGSNAGGSVFLDGYLADVNFIDGQALGPTSFGEFSAETGEWIPKYYAGTYGTNGFYLPFTNGNHISLDFGKTITNTITGAGGAKFSNAATIFGNATSMYCDGVPGSTFNIAPATSGTGTNVVSMGTGAFFMEAMVYLQSGHATVPGNSVHTIVSQGDFGPNQAWAWNIDATGTFFDFGYQGSRARSPTIPSILDGWHHLSVSRDANSVERFTVDGVLIYTRTDTANFSSVSSTNIRLCSWYDSNYPSAYGIDSNGNNLKGYLSNFRLVQGYVPAEYATTTTTLGTQVFAVPTTAPGSYNNRDFSWPKTKVWIPTNGANNATTGTYLTPYLWNDVGHSFAAGVNYDWMLDTPSNNYPVLNSLDKASAISVVGGGLGSVSSVNTAQNLVRGSAGVSAGKWYWEQTLTGGTGIYSGIATASATLSPVSASAIYVNDSGQLYVDSNNTVVTTYPLTVPVGGTIGVALDCDAGNISWYFNGVLAGTRTFTPGATWYPIIGNYNTGTTYYINFGQQPFTYTPPVGYGKLCAKAIATTTTRNEKHFSVKTYVGNGGNLQVGEVQKAIDLVTINQSLRFRSEASAHLRRSPAVTGNRQKFTFSTWVKRSAMGSYYALLGCEGVTGSDYMGIRFTNTDNLQWFESGGQTGIVSTVETYRDTSNWMHVLCIFDSANATQADRQQIWVNGVRTTLSGSNVAQNFVSVFNVAGYGHVIGAQMSGPSGAGIGAYHDGYMADVHLIDGQVVLPTNFGQFDANGYWVPKTYTGTYGTNGFRLTFSDNNGTTATTLGKDSSGNSNNWTPNNFSLVAGGNYDWMIDTPTNKYATLDPLMNAGSSVAPYMFSGNLAVTDNSASAAWKMAGVNIPPSAVGKVFFEFKVYQSIANSFGTYLNLLNVLPNLTSLTDAQIAANGTPSLYWNTSANLIAGPGAVTVGTVAGGDYLQFAIDYDNGYMWVGRNGVWLTGNPATGVSPTSTFTPRGRTSTAPITLHTYSNSTSTGVAGGSINFGQQAFAYSVPAGFLTLCENNVAEYGYDVETPDLVIIKSRGTANYGWTWVDRVRGANTYLDSASTGAQVTDVETVKSFNKNGFYLGKAPRVNTVNENYVAYTMKMGGAPVANAAGSIASQVSVNAVTGMSVVTYIGNGVNSTVGHGLGVAPKMVIIKNLGSIGSAEWLVGHSAIGFGNFLLLSSTQAQVTANNRFNNTAPTSSVFSIGTIPASNTETYVAYCFAEVPGFSKFGSYTGNGSADGPFINCGFKPALVMVKRTDAAGNWCVNDSVRSQVNPVNEQSQINLANAESGTGGLYDFDSNGFKVRSTATDLNASGGTYIYWAMGSVPQQFANAR